MIELVVFDMAGTTVDEDNVVYKTVRDAINQAGYDVSLDRVQAHGAGKEKSQAIRDVLASLGTPPSDAVVASIFASFRNLLAEAYRDLDVKEQPDAGQVFFELRKNGIKVVLNTGYDRVTAENLLQKLGWAVDTEIDGLVTASDVEEGRPAADMIQKAMTLTGVKNPKAVVKIGDSEIDIQEGKNANCGMTFGITTGAQTTEQLQHSRPTAIVDSLRQFCDRILSS